MPGAFSFGFGLSLSNKGAGVPSWVPVDDLGTPFLFALDTANSRGYHKGTVYPDETSFLSATGGSKSGIVRTFGPFQPADAVNILTDGDGSTTGWNLNGTATAATVSGELEVTWGGGSTPNVSHSITGALNKAFKFSAFGRRDTAPNSPGLFASHLQTMSTGVFGATWAAAETGRKDMLFSGNIATMYVGYRHSGGVATGKSEFDDATVIEQRPFDGWLPGAGTILVEGNLPASAATKKVLAQIDSDNERDRVTVYLDTDGLMKVEHNNANNTYRTTLGSQPGFGGFASVAVSMASQGLDDFRLCINGAAVQSNGSNLTIPGAAKLRLGQASGGLFTWDGTVSLVAVAPRFIGPASGAYAAEYLQRLTTRNRNDVRYGEGDSYFAGANGVSLQADLRSGTTIPLISSAVGGSTLQQIYDRLTARPWIKGKPLVIWDGSANSYGTVAATLAIVDQIIAWHGDASKIVMVPSVAVGPSSDGVVSSYTLDMEAIRDGIIARGLWPSGAGNDPTTQINTLSTGTAQDLKDISARVVLQSALYSGDAVHLSQAAMSKVSPLVQAVQTARGI